MFCASDADCPASGMRCNVDTHLCVTGDDFEGPRVNAIEYE